MNLEPITERKRVSQYIFTNTRPFLIAFILFTVIVVMTTDIKLVTISSLTSLGLEFFIILFCSYGMYICCTDGGVKEGYEKRSKQLDAHGKHQTQRNRGVGF